MRLHGLSALCRARHIARLPRKVPTMMGIEHKPALAKCDGDRPWDSVARATPSQILSFEGPCSSGGATNVASHSEHCPFDLTGCLVLSHFVLLIFCGFMVANAGYRALIRAPR